MSTEAAAAYERLMHLAETRDSGQIHKIASFIAATYNSRAYHFDLRDLCAVDHSIRADMLAVINALEGFSPHSYDLVPNGEKRAAAVIKLFGIRPISYADL